MKQKNLVITGSSGWISSEIIHKYKKSYKESYNLYLINRDNYEKKLKELTSKKINNIYLIHNAFIKPTNIENKSLKDYKRDLSKLSNNILEFISNNDIKAIFYPSSGVVYKQRVFQNDFWDLYIDQKIFDEKEFINISDKKNINLLILRIFTLLGRRHNDVSNALSSLIYSSIDNNEIKLTATNNHVHSFGLIENLVASIFKVFESPKNQIRCFDFVDETMDIEGFSKLISSNFNNIKIKNNYDDKSSCYKYVGSEEDYINFIREFDLETKSISYFLKNLKSTNF